ncbi:MAG: hypothetical protein FWF57_09380 [Defluviitaleaceae bacterium]|nr:hypothetical protein [Defluviitaleaceae bacterium]
MKDRILNFYNTTTTKWKNLGSVQKRRLIFASSAVLLALGFVIFLTVRPDWVVLHRNLEFSQSSAIQEILNERGIRNRLVQGGRVIEVRRQDYNQAAVEIRGNSDVFINNTDFSFPDALEQIGMGTSEDSRTEMFRRSQESDIAAALRQINGIEDANVTLHISDRRGQFLGISQSRASVVLTTSTQFDQSSALTLASTVANAVEGLTIDNVVITDQHLRNIFNGTLTGNDRFAQNSSEQDISLQQRARMEHGVMSLLSGVFDHVRVNANVVVDMSEQTIVSREYADPAGTGQGFVQNNYNLSEEAEGTAPVLPEAGAAPNAGFGVFGMGMTGDVSASREEVNQNFLFNHQETVTINPAGTLNFAESNISVISTRTILVEQDNFNNGVVAEDLAFEEGMTWEALVSANQSPAPIEAGEEWLIAISNATGIPVENVSFMIFSDFVFVPSMPTPINWQTLVLAGILAAFIAMIVYALMKRDKIEETAVLEIEPELSVEDLLVSTKIEEIQFENRETLQEIAYSIDSEVKVQIDKFVNEKPEAVAQLLRNWMSEGWE